MIDTVKLRRCQLKYCTPQFKRTGRISQLVVDHADTVFCFGKLKHCADKVLSFTVKPCGTHYEPLLCKEFNKFLSRKLCAAVRTLRTYRIILGTRHISVPRENIIRRDMYKLCINFISCDRQITRTQRIYLKCKILIFLTTVHICGSGAVYDHVGLKFLYVGNQCPAIGYIQLRDIAAHIFKAGIVLCQFI